MFAPVFWTFASIVLMIVFLVEDIDPTEIDLPPARWLVLIWLFPAIALFSLYVLAGDLMEDGPNDHDFQNLWHDYLAAF